MARRIYAMLAAVNVLSEVEARVLGALIEKELTTPEYYPLSLNALVNACNQKSNRDPAMNLAEDEVYAALSMLREKGLSTTLSNSRVPKYGHRFTDKLNLGRRESAVICELMLSGPQTLGELRSRSERMHPFSDLEEVEAVIRHLTEEGMATRLDRLPGTKETRYAHLFSGEPVIS